MADWKWPSIEDKLEAIGFLAAPGVISSIEATVPIGKKEKFREEYKNKYSDEYPYEANKFAMDYLINRSSYKKLLTNISERSIVECAKENDVCPAIVVGRLVHDKKIRYGQYNDLVRTINWKE